MAKGAIVYNIKMKKWAKPLLYFVIFFNLTNVFGIGWAYTLNLDK